MMFRRLEPPPKVPAPRDQLLQHDGISMTVQSKRPFPERTVRLLITLMGSIGTLLCMYGFFDFPLEIRSLLIVTVVLTCSMRLIRTFAPRIGFGLILVGFAAIPALLLRHREAAVIGAGAIYNIMRRKVLWQAYFPDPSVHVGDWNEAKCVQFVFLLLMIALVCLLEYSDVLMTHSQSSTSGFWIRFLVTFPFLESGLYFGLETYSYAVFMLIFFWIGTIAVARKSPSGKLLAEQGHSASIQYSFLDETERNFTVHENGAAVILAACAALCAMTLVSTKNYVRSEKMNQKRQELREAYRQITIKDVTGLLQRIPGSLGINVLSDELDLMQNGDLHFDGRTVLHASIGTAAAPDDYYLRGIVRSEYTGRGWAMPNALYRKNQKLFQRLTSENRMPQTIFHSDHAEELRTAANGKYPVVSCRMTAMKQEQVNFLPYQSIYDLGTKFRYDIEIELENTKDYTFWMLNNAGIHWDMLAERTAPSVSPVVSEYEAFVKENYLSVPDNEAMNRIMDAFAPYMPSQDLPLDQRLAAIRDYIWERADYTTQPGQQPPEEDYVEYFLTTGHKGFCAHYASSAVLLCRMCGIPARYCQGYVMTQNNFVQGKNFSGYEIDIPDDQAHAWAEIYVEGFGWMPYEFTESVMETWHRPIESSEQQETTAVTQTTAVAAQTQTTAVTTASDAQMTQTSTAVQDGTLPNVLTPEQLKRIKMIVLSIAVLILLAAGYYAVHCRIISRRNRAMHDRNPNHAAQASYHFIVQMLAMRGIEQNQLTHDDFAEKAEAACKLLPKGRIRSVSAIVQESVFSRSGITNEDAEKVSAAAEQLAQAMYQEAKTTKKLWLRWVKHLIR